MAEFCLDPKKFQEQIDKYSEDSTNIKGMKYDISEDGLILQSVDKYLECLTAFNDTVALLGQLMDQDTASMKTIKANWMKLDADIAEKTLWQLITGK